MRQPPKGSIREFLTRYPQKEGEPNYIYYERIKKIAFEETNQDFEIKSISNKASKFRKYFQTVSEKLDKNGNVIASQTKLQTKIPADTKGAQKKKFATYKGDEVWASYEVVPNPPPDITPKFIDRFIGNIQLIDKKPKIKKRDYDDSILIATHTDNHTGMETDQMATSMYGFVWNKDVHMERKQIYTEEVIASYSGEREIHIWNLGDLVDGWDGFTTRGGHTLPQNMDNEEAFIVAGRFLIESIDTIQKYTKAKVIVHSIANSNHGGSFEKIVNRYAKDILAIRNPYVEFYIHNKFLQHYIWENFCFILTHGKDDIFRKKPLPLVPDKATIQFILNYIKKYRLYDYKVVLGKGDSHRQLHDYDSSPDFDYLNFRAFCTASQWAETNFVSVDSGFSISRATKGKKHMEITPYVFDDKNSSIFTP
jgi:hypothetical protein